MSIETQLMASHHELRQHILLLTEILEQHAVDATVYQFPNHTLEDLGKEPDVIPVTAIHGQMAIAKALLHYLHFQTDEHQPGAFTLKLAGTLRIECEEIIEQEIRQRISLINQLKSAFEKQILAINPTSVDIRFEVFKNALPNQCKLSITRQLPVALPTIHRINYAWTNRKVGGNINRDKLLKKIQRARSQPKPSDIMGEWLAGLDREEMLIAGYPPSAIFIERRDTRITPMMKLHYSSNHTPRETSIHAHSPLIVINDQPKTSELRTYLRFETPDAREEKYELVIPRLYLYLLSADGKLPEGSKRKISR